MRGYRFWLGCLVVGFVLLAGCGGLIQGHTDPTPGSGSVQFHYQINDTGKYGINGSLDVELAVEDPVVFRDVTICAYDSEGTLLSKFVAGDFASPGTRRSVSFTIGERPAYLIVDHPQFRSYDLAPHIWDWTGNRRESVPGYPEEYIEEFDYQPPKNPGDCATAATP